MAFETAVEEEERSMAYVSLLLLVFVSLGLARNRLGRFGTYAVMGLVIVAYVAYVYHRPQ